MKNLLTIVLSVHLSTTIASASVKQVTVNGTLQNAHNLDLAGLTTSVPATFEAQFDDALAFDWAPSPTLGVYYFDSLPVSLTAGDRTFATVAAELRVYAGEGGLWGFSIGNRFEVDASGLTLDPYYGISAAFVSPFPEARAAFPTDALSNVTPDSLLRVMTLAYATIAGDRDGVKFSGQINTISSVAITNVPEPSSITLAFLAGAWLVGRSRRSH